MPRFRCRDFVVYSAEKRCLAPTPVNVQWTKTPRFPDQDQRGSRFRLPRVGSRVGDALIELVEREGLNPSTPAL